MAQRPPQVSIVVPTYREAGNLPILIPRLASVMDSAGRTYELLIVDDDSRDGTDGIVRDLAGEYPVRLIVRTGQRDLSLAVAEGLREARGDCLVVMDADLSHPPEGVPDLLAALARPPTDFVIGSRYVAGGTTQDWGLLRALNSRVATVLCRPLTGPISDPMAGFFALRRETLQRARRLEPIGYKIGLELICRCGCVHVVEVPIVFRNRAAGKSKLNVEQQVRYLIHLTRLYGTLPRGRGRVIRWGLHAALAVLAVYPGTASIVRRCRSIGKDGPRPL